MAEDERFVEIVRALHARPAEHQISPSLAHIQRLMESLGNPQGNIPIIHVAGTNGKTSTARIIDQILRQLGLRTGRFTSPHLHAIQERICLDGAPISIPSFITAWDDIQAQLAEVDRWSTEQDQPLMNEFQVLTAMAFSAFVEAPVDVAVVEVGLGGTWDSTNVADGQVAVIAAIGIDHQEYLGQTLAQIAAEKAGIIKAQATAVIAAQAPDALVAVVTRAAEVGAAVVVDGEQIGLLARELAVDGQIISVRGMAGDYPDLFLPLHGEHQAHNAVLAIAAVEAFIGGGADPLDLATVRDALASVTSPGRLEVVRRSPTVLVDAAHNVAGAQALAATMQTAFTFNRLVGVVGVLRDKDAEGILGALEPILSDIIITTSRSSRSYSPEDLGQIAQEVFGEDRVQVCDRVADALSIAIDLAEDAADLGTGVLATGSVTVVAEVRALLGAA